MSNYFEKLQNIATKLRMGHVHGGHFCVEFDPHLACYDSPARYLSFLGKYDLKSGIVDECDRLNKLVTIQFYPYSPVEHQYVCDVTLEGAAKQMVGILNRKINPLHYNDKGEEYI